MFEIFTPVSEREAKNMSPVTLAFVGDAVFTLYVRRKLVQGSDFPLGTLQKLTAEKVSAHGQNLLLERIAPLLTEDEADIFRRGRNAKKGTRAKNASVVEYNNSTGVEAVLGYLYLTGQGERLNELLSGDWD